VGFSQIIEKTAAAQAETKPRPFHACQTGLADNLLTGLLEQCGTDVTMGGEENKFG